MKKINSRDKGARAERELANILKDYNFIGARRGQQFCGNNGDPDVLGLPGFHIECKHVEALNIYDAINQAKDNCRAWDIPIVCHKKNRKEWLVTMPMNFFIENIILGQALIKDEEETEQ